MDSDVGRAEEAIDGLHELAGGRELLAVARRRTEDVELVGGAVRDILLGREPRELDVVVGEDAYGFAVALAQHVETTRGGDAGADAAGRTSACADAAGGESGLGADAGGEGGQAELTHHERFGTAVVRWPGVRVDIATRRSERYPAPGALPEVSGGTPEQDLARRDFTVNAIAVALTGEPRLRAAPHALEDLRARTLRVLHEQSFEDDPTRILRLARYRTRLGFDVESHTAELARQALQGGALRSVSGERLGAEVRLALDEDDAPAVLGELDRMGVFEAWEPGVCFDEPMARAALGILPEDGDPRILLCAAMVVDLMSRMAEDEDTEGAVLGFLRELELPAGHAQRAFSAGIIANCAARWLDGAETTGEMLDLMEGSSIEGLSLGAAMADIEWGPRCYTRSVIEDWLYKHRHIELHITGEDLLAAGLPEGPEIGRRLERVFTMRMIGMVEEGREAELSAALADD